MRTFLACFFSLALLVACRSHKEVQSHESFDSDSVSVENAQHSVFSVDSLLSVICFDFDTLDVSMGRLAMGDTIESFRLKAVKGKVVSNRNIFRQAAESKSRLDSTAFKLSSSESSAEHEASTAVYEPPNSSAIAANIIAIAALLLVIYFFFRRQ